MLELEELPFEKNALEPFLSLNTVKLHYEKHHQAYVDKVNELIIATDFQDMSLEDIILKTADVPEDHVLYNNAGQVYNHNIYWQSFEVWNRLDEDVKTKIMLKFGSRDELKRKLTDAALSVFGSGWVWLVRDDKEDFLIVTTKNGDTPLPHQQKPIFNIDVWEHAYYLDYQNLRKKYVENFVAGVLKI
jgi:Fe-Mn family superoxide dismutase